VTELLHSIGAPSRSPGGIELGDTLSPDGERFAKADIVLTNPPFGTKKGRTTCTFGFLDHG
jgi:type I restriction-modification system DNA methylase subunit